MFDSFRTVWRDLKRWWRDTPLAFKILTPMGLIIAMILPFEITALGDGLSFEKKGKRSDRLPYPTDFGPGDETTRHR